MSPKKSTINLKSVADRVGLAPCSVSAVLNDTPASRTIPQITKDRIFKAAAEMNYRPNFWARSLRTKRTRMVAVVAPDLGSSIVGIVISAVQEVLCRRGYLLVLSSMGQRDEHFPASLQQRGVEGLISIDTSLPNDAGFPVATIDLSYLSSTELIGDGMRLWLSDLGRSAAETIIREVEGAEPARKVAVSIPVSPQPFGFARQSYTSRETA